MELKQKIVVSALDKVGDETPLTKKKVNESRVLRTISDVIIKYCLMVLCVVDVEAENKASFGFILWVQKGGMLGMEDVVKTVVGRAEPHN